MVTASGGQLLVSGDGVTGRLIVSGLLSRAVLAFGAPAIQAVLDASGGSITVTGQLRWTDSEGDLVLKARNITVTPGTVVDTGSGDLGLHATDQAGNGRDDASASVTVTGATLQGGNLVISADSSVDLSVNGTNATVDTSSSATVTVLDSHLGALGGISLSSSSTVSGTAVATGSRQHTAADHDAANATVVVDSTSVTRLGGASVVSAGGLVAVHATNRTDATAIGDASRATAGAGVARVVVDRTTRAVLDGAGPGGIIAAGLDVLARATGSLKAYSLASAGGATGNDVSTGDLTGGTTLTTNGTLPAGGRPRVRPAARPHRGRARRLRRLHRHGHHHRRPAGPGRGRRRSSTSRPTPPAAAGPGVAAAIAIDDLATLATLTGRLTLQADGIDLAADTTGTSTRPTPPRRAPAPSPSRWRTW